MQHVPILFTKSITACDCTALAAISSAIGCSLIGVIVENGDDCSDDDLASGERGGGWSLNTEFDAESDTIANGRDCD